MSKGVLQTVGCCTNDNDIKISYVVWGLRLCRSRSDASHNVLASWLRRRVCTLDGGRADAAVDNMVGPACCQDPTKEGACKASGCLYLLLSLKPPRWLIWGDFLSISVKPQAHSHNGSRESSQFPLGAQNLRAAFIATQGELTWWKTWEPMQHLLNFLKHRLKNSKSPLGSIKHFSSLGLQLTAWTKPNWWLAGWVFFFFFHLMTSLS